MRDEDSDRRVDRALADIAAGDIGGVGELYDLMGHWVYRVALLITGRPSAAEAATVAAFTFVWKNAGHQTVNETAGTQWVLEAATSCARLHLSDAMPSASPVTAAPLHRAG